MTMCIVNTISDARPLQRPTHERSNLSAKDVEFFKR